MHGAVLGVVGRCTVQHDARAHPVGVAGAQAQQGSAVAQAAFTGQVCRGVLKHLALLERAVKHVGIAKVGHQRNFGHLRQGIQARPSGAERRRTQAQAVHTAVHF